MGSESHGSPNAVGRVLDDRYELLELVGAGGMAEVWRARDRRLDREVAVKVLSGVAARDPSRRKRIEREARALAAAHHPNIVAVYDYGEAPTDTGRDDDVVPYVVMELVDGPDLQRYVRERGPLPVDEVRLILHGVLEGVERAHAVGVVHGDLKSGNVFVGSHGPKVGDFGVARILDQETGTTTLAATPTFAAPEVLRGERATPASDVYSASCLAFELLTGRPPFEGANGWEVAQKHLEAPAPKLRSLRSDVPSDLDGAISRGMDKNPRRRFGRAAEFAAAIGASAAGAPAHRPTETVPVADHAPAASSGAGSPPTEAITRPGPDVGKVAVLGPFAGLWERLADRRRATDRRDDRGRRRWLVAASIALLLLLGLVLTNRDSGDEPVAVPDVKGESLVDAAAKIRTKGFDVGGVSYRPVTEGKAGQVLATVPATGELVEPGSSVHLIASALAATPEPVVQERGGGDEEGKDGRAGGDESTDRDEGKGRGKKGHEKHDD